MIKTRFALTVLAATAAIAIAGCGSSDSSSTDLAGFAPPGSLIYLEGDIRPSGELQANVDSLAQKIGGVDSLGDLIAEKLDDEAEEEGNELDFAKEVEPWLGDRAAAAFTKLDDEGDPAGYLLILSATDADAAQSFIDHQAEVNGDPGKKGSYEGVDYWTDTGDDSVVGMIDGSFVQAEDTKSFEAAVDASSGDALADEARFADAISAASSGSLADVYVDVGGLLDASDDEIDPQARETLRNAGIDPSEATAVASVMPGSDQVQIDLSSDLGGEEAPSGDVSELLGTLPGDSFAAFAATDFGEQLKEAIDNLDAEGIEDSVPPNQLKSTLKAIGIDLDKIADSLEGAAVFAQGNTESELGGALVLTSSSNEAAKAVANIGVLLRNTRTPGVTAVTSSGASGFSVRDEELGRKPLVVVAKGDRVAIGYGPAAALQGLNFEGGTMLSETANYKAAVSALGSTPISAFVDGPAALSLAESLVPRSETDFQEAKPYLRKITYVGIGGGTDDELATAKLIVGIEK